MLAVYSQQAIDAGTLATVATATQASIEYDKINNKLAPLASMIEKAYELAWRVAFNYYGSQAESVMFAFPQDFKLQSISTLMAEYKQALEAQMPYQVLQAIRGDIMKKVYRNSPEVISLANALEQHRPMRSKTTEEALMLLQLRDPADPERQLYEQWDNVTQEMELLNIPFYLLTYQEQRSRMYDSAARYAANVVYGGTGAAQASDMEAMLIELQRLQEVPIEQPIEQPIKQPEEEIIEQ
jgi:hypothetical protein